MNLTIREIAPTKINKYLAKLKCPPTITLRGQNEDIIGKWELVESHTIDEFCSLLEDNSCDTIVFEFAENNTLKITGTTKYWKEGVYKYSYILDKNRNFAELNIEGFDKAFNCFVARYKMKLVQSDSRHERKFFFIRIK